VNTSANTKTDDDREPKSKDTYKSRVQSQPRSANDPTEGEGSFKTRKDLINETRFVT